MLFSGSICEGTWEEVARSAAEVSLEISQCAHHNRITPFQAMHRSTLARTLTDHLPTGCTPLFQQQLCIANYSATTVKHTTPTAQAGTIPTNSLTLQPLLTTS